jgi:Glycosyl hydrolases family 43
MENDTEPLQHHLHDHKSDGRSEKSMENSHLLETSPFIKTVKSANLEGQGRPRPNRRPSNPTRTLIFCFLIALLAMVVLRRLTCIVLSLLCLHSVSAALQIVPGAAWTDVGPTTYIVQFTCLIFFQAVTGKHLQAHGPGIIKVENTYYMIGEDKFNGSSFQNVNCYASTNLVEWKFAGALLSRTSSGDLGPNRVVERPKVIYNKSTKKYVLYMHIDDSTYKEAKVGVAIGDTVCGKYEYVGSYRPMENQSRDMGLYQDEDGNGYLLSEDVCSTSSKSHLALACKVLMKTATKRPPHLQTHI